MPKCPQCGQEVREGHYACERCGAQLPAEPAEKPEVEKADQAEEQPESREPVSNSRAESAGEVAGEPRKDTWDRLGERWDEMTVGAQVAAISCIVGMAGFLIFLFALARAGLERLPLSLWVIIFPFVLSLYLLVSSSDAPRRQRIVIYAAAACLGALWFQPMLIFRIQGIWWSFWLLGLIGLVGGAFLALWDLAHEMEP